MHLVAHIWLPLVWHSYLVIVSGYEHDGTLHIDRRVSVAILAQALLFSHLSSGGRVPVPYPRHL